MSNKIKELNSRFKDTLDRVSVITSIPIHELKRDDYVRVCVDLELEGRLNKEELNHIGGFKAAKRLLFGDPSVLKDGPKILVVDIETAPMLGYVWSLWNNNVGLNQLNKDWHLLSFAAKWLGDSEDKVIYMDQRDAENIEDDTPLLAVLWDLMNEADILITQNGRAFDVKKINARFVMQGFKPPSSFRQIDTKIIAKKHFGFTSNKLEYMTSQLCTKYKKSKHAQFNGFELWKACLAGNVDAWNEMEDYNKLDILSLEELYYKLIPWDNSINFNIYSECVDTICTCGNDHFEENGFYYTNLSKFQRYTCSNCGSEMRGRENLLEKSKRKGMKTGTVR